MQKNTWEKHLIQYKFKILKKDNQLRLQLPNHYIETPYAFMLWKNWTNYKSVM